MFNVIPPLAVIVGRVIGLVIGFTIHEFAHAWTALRLGDNLAYNRGRVTLDPRAHLEPIGIILALIVGFGWAKPVPVNPQAYYPNEQRGMMIVALAGPVSNLIMTFVFGLPLRLMVEIGIISQTSFLYEVWHTVIIFNILLMLFNLIPLSPLDGWKIMLGVVSPIRAMELQRYERESYVALILLLIVGSPIMFAIFAPLIDLVFNVATLGLPR